MESPAKFLTSLITISISGKVFLLLTSIVTQMANKLPAFMEP